MSQEKIRLLLVENDPAEVREFTAYGKTVSDVELVGTTDSASEGLALVQELSPHGVVLDLELAEGDGLDFLVKLQELPAAKRPYVVVTTNTTARVTLQALRDNGAGLILMKTNRGYSCRQVVDKFRMVRRYLSWDIREEAPASSAAGEARVRSKLSEDLERLGITPNLKGHQYIIDAVLMMIAEPRTRFEVSRKIYPVVAEKYHMPTANIERCIRSAIETAWLNTPPETLHEVYTAAIRSGKRKPVNKELICFFAVKYAKL